MPDWNTWELDCNFDDKSLRIAPRHAVERSFILMLFINSDKYHEFLVAVEHAQQLPYL